MSEPIIIDTPEGIALYRLLALAKGCEFYARHGMHLSRTMPTVKQLREQYGITARTYEQAGEQLRALVPEPGTVQMRRDA